MNTYIIFLLISFLPLLDLYRWNMDWFFSRNSKSYKYFVVYFVSKSANCLCSVLNYEFLILLQSLVQDSEMDEVLKALDQENERLQQDSRQQPESPVNVMWTAPVIV